MKFGLSLVPEMQKGVVELHFSLNKPWLKSIWETKKWAKERKEGKLSSLN